METRPVSGNPATRADASPLLAEMRTARRPTGPILGVVAALVLLVAGQLIAEIVVGIASGGAVLNESGPMSASTQLVMTLSFAGSALALFAWVRWKEDRPVRSLGFRLTGRTVTRIGRGALVGLGMMAVLVLVNVVFGEATFGGGFRVAELGVVVVALLGFVVQSSTEEIFTRGYLTQAVGWKWGVVAAIVVQTVVFTALHLANGGITVWAVLNLALVAVFLGFWSLAEGGLWGVCAFHAVWNWSQGNVFGIEVSHLKVADSLLAWVPANGSSALLTGGSFGIEGSALTSVVLAAGCVVAYRAFRRQAAGTAPEARQISQ